MQARRYTAPGTVDRTRYVKVTTLGEGGQRPMRNWIHGDGQRARLALGFEDIDSPFPR